MLCASGIVPKACAPLLHLSTCFSSCPTIRCETERNLCPVTDPHSCCLRAVLHSRPVCSSLYDPSLENRWVGQYCPCQSCLHREIKAASTSCDSIHCMSKEPFSPSLPHDPISLFHVQTKVRHILCTDIWIN